jgi:hypothetical protein
MEGNVTVRRFAVVAESSHHLPGGGPPPTCTLPQRGWGQGADSPARGRETALSAHTDPRGPEVLQAWYDSLKDSSDIEYLFQNPFALCFCGFYLHTNRNKSLQYRENPHQVTYDIPHRNQYSPDRDTSNNLCSDLFNLSGNRLSLCFGFSTVGLTRLFAFILPQLRLSILCWPLTCSFLVPHPTEH